MARLLVLLILSIFSIILAACAPINPTTPTHEPTLIPDPTVVVRQASPTVDPASQPKPTQPSGLAPGQQTIVGVVLSGGDTTPKDLLDAPRTFVYQVQLEDGTAVDVKFITYPPSPAGDRLQIPLEFDTGGIIVGQYLEARGTYNPSTNTLFASEEGDYIKTYTEKP